jgi:hypothetical protein
MIRSLAPVRLLAAALLTVATVGCAGAGSSPALTGRPSVPPPTVVPLTTPEPSVTSDPPAASLGEPPAATMAAEGGDAVAGSLGSFLWGDGGSDSPWLPGAPVAIGAGESLTVTLPGDIPVTDWVTRRIAAGSLDGSGAVSLGSGHAAPIMFAAPAPGAWSVQVAVTFGDDLGAATYYWAATVR